MSRSTNVITYKNYCNKFETSIMTSILFDVEWFESTETKNTTYKNSETAQFQIEPFLIIQ